MNTDGLRLKPTQSGVRLELRVIPRASKTAVDGVRDGRLVVRVTAPPVDRAANEAVVLVLATALGVPKRAVRLISGETARNKSVEIEGLTIAEVRQRI